VLCALFILFQQIHVRVSPLFFNLIFKKQARADEVLRDYRQSIGNLNQSSVEADLLGLLDQLHAPRIFIAYQKQKSDYIQAREFTRLIQSDVFPPPALERDLVNFFKQHGGGLIFDLQNIARNNGDVSVFQELSLFSSLGVEFVLSIGQTDPLQIIMAGLARDAHPFDHTDLEQLHSIEVATALAIRNHGLLESVESLKQRLEEENKRISSQLNRSLPDLPAAGKSAAFVYSAEGPMARVLAELELFAQKQNPLLLVGETGTGKEQLARFVHTSSGRAGQWVAINCSAIPADLLENELFGHEKGAYTGATDSRSGVVERAEHGTLFLDEIGEMPAGGQAKLLRLIQEGEYEKLGGTSSQKSTARLIFATNRNLETEVASGAFREDLYYRISTFEVRVPPLRERQADIDLLIDHFLMIFCQQLGRELVSLSREARQLLCNYNWPGNVRELENLLLRMLVLSDRQLLEIADLPVFFSESANFSQKKEKLGRLAREQEKLEKELLLEALEQTAGNQREAAALLNISRGSLQYRMKSHGLSN
jgi:transcriptional regulator with GAF, ATPase, and Fis domain